VIPTFDPPLDGLKRAPGISEGVAQQISDFSHTGG
jgi:hypothetical protein